MKKKVFFLLLVVAGMLSVSCFKGKKEEKPKENKETGSQSPINGNITSSVSGDIFNLGKNNNEKQENKGQENIKNLTPEEQKNLIDNKIDPAKVSQAIKDAESGSKEAILSLAHLYYGLNDSTKVKKYLQMGVDKNYPEAIYNMAMILKEEGKTVEAEKLMARLPKNVENGQLPPGAQAYNKGIGFIKSKNYKEAKAQFESAYRQGIKEADIQIALLNKQTRNYSEAVKWFKLAANRGIKEANFEIGAILFDTGRQVEARPYLTKAYNSGNKALAMPIAISYHKENNINEALKWYKIAAKNGNSDAKQAIAEIEGNKSASGKSGVNQFLNSGKQNSNFIDNTLSQTKKSENIPSVKKSLESNSKNLSATSTVNKNAKQSTAREKQNYNIEIEEITNSRVKEFNK
ncbi:sel1 repeat family protein [Leptotrichia sp. OH3620_COT-345]|uniref:tetratricopeptide repeat protein n=1 Tax=Leptotrichia sp. OH3620_COT-345 TaxID=2491048 RepID=UPI000F64D56D|nr:tetratricopeptide repeat protein [Leptotrichia sp. OH3620_COT-345]RRD40936.1 sel1 repeat family protein [Leptotrichia sp. OH3620_COT-345]